MSINWDTLQWLSVPRAWSDEHSARYEQIKGKPFWFVFWGGGISGWKKEMSEGYLVRIGVVQANEALFDKETAEYAPAVIAWFDDPAMNGTDEAVTALLSKIDAARASDTPRADCQPFLDLLDNEDSRFAQVAIPMSLTGGKKAFASVDYVDPDDLPGGCVPANRIVPGFRGKEAPSMIPPSFYK